jgi:hypothetical protein
MNGVVDGWDGMMMGWDDGRRMRVFVFGGCGGGGSVGKSFVKNEPDGKNQVNPTNNEWCAYI